jgi:hypothetical protein
MPLFNWCRNDGVVAVPSGAEPFEPKERLDGWRFEGGDTGGRISDPADDRRPSVQPPAEAEARPMEENAFERNPWLTPAQAPTPMEAAMAPRWQTAAVTTNPCQIARWNFSRSQRWKTTPAE